MEKNFTVINIKAVKQLLKYKGHDKLVGMWNEQVIQFNIFKLEDNMDNTIAKIVTNVVQELGVGIDYYIMSSNSPKYRHLVNRGISMGYQLVHLESDFNALYNRDTCYIFIPSDFVMQGGL